MTDNSSCAGAAVKPVIIGICGGTGSGKTTLAARLCGDLGGDALLLSMDSYYRAHYDMTFEQRKLLNYDHPDSIDTPLLAEQLTLLRAGVGVDVPVYDFPTHQRTDRTERAEPHPVIVIEGILLLCYPQFENLLDLTVFVDAPADLRFIRRLMRDAVERGRSTESVVSQYLLTVRPMHEQFVEPCRARADVVYSGEAEDGTAYESVLARVRALMPEKVGK